jgi:hypothetical protein
MSDPNIAIGLNIKPVFAPDGNDHLCQMGPIAKGESQILILGAGLYSPSRAFRLYGQLSDGNYVLQYAQTASLPSNWPNVPTDPMKVTWITYWATNTALTEIGDGGPVNNVLYMQDDGNMVVYDRNRGTGPSAAVFASNTTKGGGSFLRMEDNGNLTITAPDGSNAWSSDTSVGPIIYEQPPDVPQPPDGSQITTETGKKQAVSARA